MFCLAALPRVLHYPKWFYYETCFRSDLLDALQGRYATHEDPSRLQDVQRSFQECLISFTLLSLVRCSSVCVPQEQNRQTSDSTNLFNLGSTTYCYLLNERDFKLEERNKHLPLHEPCSLLSSALHRIMQGRWSVSLLSILHKGHSLQNDLTISFATIKPSHSSLDFGNTKPNAFSAA